MDQSSDRSPVALQRCDEFVGRTQNWMYDHLRHVSRYRPVILCDVLRNRREFPELEARSYQSDRLSRRVWRRISGGRVFPVEGRWLARRSPVVLHSHFGYVAREDFDLQARLGLPWLVGFYGADVYELGRLREWRAIYARMFERVSLVLALGPAMAEALGELGCPKDKIVVHALGIDTNEIPYQPRQLESDAVMKLLFAGTFREKKGIEFVIKAAAKARNSGVKLELHLVGDAMNKVGDDETKLQLLRTIERLGLDDVVKRYPFLPFKRLLALALECHVFVAPSVVAKNGDTEGTPFVLQQMMATGMPAIATVHSDIPFIFGEHESLLVPERDVSAIADRLVNYRDEPDLVRIHGEMLGRRIREDLDVAKCAARLSEIYDRVV